MTMLPVHVPLHDAATDALEREWLRRLDQLTRSAAEGMRAYARRLDIDATFLEANGITHPMPDGYFLRTTPPLFVDQLEEARTLIRALEQYRAAREGAGERMLVSAGFTSLSVELTCTARMRRVIDDAMPDVGRQVWSRRRGPSVITGLEIGLRDAWQLRRVLRADPPKDTGDRAAATQIVEALDARLSTDPDRDAERERR